MLTHACTSDSHPPDASSFQQSEEAFFSPLTVSHCEALDALWPAGMGTLATGVWHPWLCHRSWVDYQVARWLPCNSLTLCTRLVSILRNQLVCCTLLLFLLMKNMLRHGREKNHKNVFYLWHFLVKYSLHSFLIVLFLKFKCSQMIVLFAIGMGYDSK